MSTVEGDGNCPEFGPESLMSVCLSVVGAWCTADVKQGALFGPFKGEIVKENERKKIDFRYAWEVSESFGTDTFHL